MSFQGDVGGIGLADLLQSLARGREGVLSLMGKEGLRATLGFQEGQVHLLPDPDEDPEIWRARARSAWANDPEFRIDLVRMAEIARANRTEMVYRLLDSEGVHFRFAPGPLPEAPKDNALTQGEPGTERAGVRRDAVYVQGFSVEGLLLEYARMKDEALSAAVDWPNFEDAVLVRLDPNPVKEAARFWAACDGNSTLSEIADRLAQPQRQVRLTAIAELQRGSARLASHEELLVMAQGETNSGMAGRAAARLRAWLVCAPYGPMPTVEAQVLQTEWEAGRLQPVLRELSTPSLRVFLRRLDCALGIPLLAVDHWNEIARVRRDDRISQVRVIHLQAIASGDPNVPALRDLLAMARAFLEAKRKLAAAAVLSIAASKEPESTSVRLDLGTLMLAANMGLEAGPWILDAAATLLEEGNAEKALPPLRDYVAIDPGNREARKLLGRARTHAVQRTLVKRNSLVAIAVLVALSVGAVVQFRSQRTFDQKLEAVNAHLDDPHEALRILDSVFPGDAASRVAELRKTLVEKRRIADQAGRTAWMDRYREAQSESTLGDPVLGLRRAFEMPEPPKFGADEEPLPLLSDLFNCLAARIEAQFAELGPKVDEAPAQLKSESRLTLLLEELRGVVATTGAARPEGVDFQKRIDAFEGRLKVRLEERREKRAAKAKQDNLAQQDMLIGAARAHASAGDYERSLQLYHDLIEKDDTGKLEGLLKPEMTEVRAKSQALTRSLELSRAGKQEDAHKLLVEVLKDEGAARELPWKIESFPTGARVKFSDGAERVTPFSVQSTWDEPVPLSMELAGYEPVQWTVPHPHDQLVELSRTPERAWNPGGRIEALPVKVGEDHVVCDRDGHIARLSKASVLAWDHDLESIAGVARTPVFLPQVAGRMLLATEDGDEWLVDVSTGTLEGPWSYGKPPVQGPDVVGDIVRVRFRDGALFEWTNRLKPEAVADATPANTSDALGMAGDSGTTAGLAVLRRRSSSKTILESPWSDLEVEVGASTFTVRQKSEKKTLFLTQREGDWTYVAWEAPHARAPLGRLWTSDGRGLRSFLP